MRSKLIGISKENANCRDQCEFVWVGFYKVCLASTFCQMLKGCWDLTKAYSGSSCKWTPSGHIKVPVTGADHLRTHSHMWTGVRA